VVTTPYTVDELRERIRTLENGLAKIEKGVQFADRGVTYKTADELTPSLVYFKDQLAALLATGTTVPVRSKQTFGTSSNGF
jgi:hypothetical protein